ncbi:inactive phospholipase C-like protein 1 [Mizuhopecten yessoensis]|uniref:inactive phospholipase C-like protein 1 n=1 Tax=Mizuhopecten yessoensis TaxID=6573 RepID=UPI000B45C706|nr:inactive phospholipase C-like protein 1 [Mizuhopecten yessoensis]XP_021359617.1 inactive phospholipase C-like protein 1 [Mizuhopecten yessoensis]XP_021359618.1 inactive phospholipase C-like protein 1 [Mizuhopecten yessoensis]XP_021359620.1 inactive phospholipase C-like protein 1 [Mizuhopecten yessoensis]
MMAWSSRSQSMTFDRSPSLTGMSGRSSLSIRRTSELESATDVPINEVRAQEAWLFMQKGSKLAKIRNGQVHLNKMFCLSEDRLALKWKPSKHGGEVPTSSFKELVLGNKDDAFKHKKVHHLCQNANQCFTIKFTNDSKPLYLVADSVETAAFWMTGIKALIRFQKTADSETVDTDKEREDWLEECFHGEADINTGLLDHKGTVNLLKKLNENFVIQHVNQKLKELESAKGSEKVTCEEFKTLYKKLFNRPEVYLLMIQYASNGMFLTTDDLLLFMESVQGMSRITKDICLHIIKCFEPSPERVKQGQMGIDGFTEFLCSSEWCDIFNPDEKSVCEELMNHPINNYYIASSHNTYLTGDQVKGPASVDQYKQVLLAGCRCVELDCYDGYDDGPIIKHGSLSLTSAILFQDVIKCISEWAFYTSEYPVVLSLENHCSPKYQKQMAEILLQVLGEKLYHEEPDNQRRVLPSPNELKKKVLIKNKKLAMTANKDVDVVSDEEEEETEGEEKKKKKDEGSHTLKLAKELSDLVIFFASRGFKDFELSMHQQKYYEMCSFGESKATMLCRNRPEEFINYNKRFISRIYPKANRFNSSNFSPCEFWNCGCQMVALNYQTPGLPTELNKAFFMKNGQCGYVLQPTVIRDPYSFFTPKPSLSTTISNTDDDLNTQVDLHMKVVSGQNLSHCKVRMEGTKIYVSVRIIGIPADEATYQTKQTQGEVSSFATMFEEETFELQIKMPDLALVRFEARAKTLIGEDKLMGQYTIPFTCIKTGYRHVCLLRENGQPIEKCTLFVHTTLANKNNNQISANHHKFVSGNKPLKNYPSMKSIGVKTIDETFKISIQPLRDAMDMREDVQNDLQTFKEKCGLSPIANIKQCIRFLATRVSNNSQHASIYFLSTQEREQCYPFMEAVGDLPNNLKSAMNFYNMEFLESCKYLVQNSGKVYERLLHCCRAGLEWHEELKDVCQKAGLPEKKVKKAIDNFSWNVRVLKGQAQLLYQASQECKEYLQQIQETVAVSGLMKESHINEDMEKS